MSKELIVSVNGREKKIAIIENGRVTEFYIERGENSQGIVGNIYKGRVMRVLPGMQSAFVDIGLERDAFLYVSDFFDEEEEFERIVIDKAKSEGVDGEAAARAAAERIERARLERERQMETAQERAEPILAASVIETERTPAEEVLSIEPSLLQETETERELQTSNEKEGGDRRRRGKRDKRRGGEPLSHSSQASATDEAEVRTDELSLESPQGAKSQTFSRAEIDTPFVSETGSFERIIDEDEAAAEEGEMFKDARLQERLLDQIHAVEFDIEDTPVTEVGSLLSTSTAATSSSFQRIDDGDVDSAETQRDLQSVQQPVSASIASFRDELLEDVPSTVTATNAFERVSDDDQGTEAVLASPDTTIAKTGTRGKRSRSRRGAKGREITEGLVESGPVESLSGAATEPTETTEEAPKRKRRSRAATATSTEASGEEATASKSTSSARGRSRRTKSAVSDEPATSAEITGELQSESVDENEEAPLEDREARLTSTPPRAEFARRGGRRRRRGSGGGGKHQGGNGADTEVASDGESADAISDAEADEVFIEVAPQQEAPRRRDASNEDDNRASAPRSERSESRSSRGDGGSRGDSSSRGDNGRSGGGGGGGGGRREQRHQPTITDLLREGQEIIVQIAKEPIAAKGARITSHIALPGRYLVYMPTIEHVGVSRKIDSESERSRLRKLISAIVKDEDVPSGGFIVRTAGVGISEADLREDARYLIRTWRDIRRSAEKGRAPALVHRDLDLVQRILRDQLSDDFTAIRVDSEEEYLRVVEFINRIQPRLVKRVKLYTREEPILEAYSVQAEIDKAIKPRVWLRSGGYLVINQTEALVSIDVNTGKFVGRGGSRLEDTITRTNMEAVEEIARQIRLRDLGGIIVLDLIDMEERRNRQRVMQALQEALKSDKSPTKVLSFNDFGLVIMTRKRVKQSLERTLCSPCPYCQGAGLVKSAQTICYEVLEEARRLSRAQEGEHFKQTTLRLNPEVARALRSTERDVLSEIEEYLGPVDITSDEHVHQEQFDFAFI